MNSLAIDLMNQYAERTGIASDRPQRRYLWTDAFAVCNFLTLERVTGEQRYRELALRTVERVHATLGRHRSDDRRTGWISGLAEDEGAAHPTAGGLRIGKQLPERGADEPFDDELEWERDGQYFHYLTKWMHALDRVGRATRQPMFLAWSRELAIAAHRGFVIRTPRMRMVWKASIDLSRPLVSSMGHHDPLDGYITCLSLEATARELGLRVEDGLVAARADFASMVDPDHLATADPLGIGGLLLDARRMERAAPNDPLVERLLVAASRGLRAWLSTSDRRMPSQRRLAFRELGVSIGLGAIEGMSRTQNMAPFTGLRGELEAFWSAPAHRATATWRDHADIDDVMLATSLLPDAFVG